MICALAVGLAVLAIIFARPVLLAATVMIGAWILTRQYLFVREFSRTVDSVAVTQSPSTTSLRTGNSTTVTLKATLGESSPLHLGLTAGVPPTATVDELLELTIGAGTTEKTQTVTVDWPVAGNHQFREARLSASDGLFKETVSIGSTPAITVEPLNPRSMHVGAGGTRVPMVQGEHETGKTGSGLEPAELREYVPGDTAEKIDWKATARLATPHVRTYESETDRPTLIVMDQRNHLTIGSAGETKLDYLREVALTIAASAHRLGDPLGHLAVGNEGITSRIRPTTGSGAYTTIRRELLELEPTEPETREQAGRTQHGAKTVTSTRTSALSSDEKRQNSGSTTAPTSALETLGNDEDQFTQQLKPFYENQTVYSTRIQTDPFSNAVESMVTDQRGNAFVVLCTDDSNPNELKKTVRLARANDNSVMVLLTPTVLFESGGLLDAESAYDTYLSFETLRRDLDRLDGVSALEIGPGDRLAAVLAAGGQ